MLWPGFNGLSDVFPNYPVGFQWTNLLIASATQLGWTLFDPRVVAGWSIAFDDTDTEADPIRVDLIRGNGLPSSATAGIGRLFDTDQALALSVNAGWQAIGSWTEQSILESHLIHPAGGSLQREYPAMGVSNAVLMGSRGGNLNVLALAIRVTSNTIVRSMTLHLYERT